MPVVFSEMEEEEADDIVVLNVGGVRHETLRSTLNKFPGSKLSQLDQLHDHFRPDRNEYFFDRHPQIFAAILNYYRIGELHVPTDFCSASLKKELAYWELEASSLERCCLVRYSEQLVRQRTLEKLDNTTIFLQASHKPENQNGRRCPVGGRKKWCNKVWTFLEEPHSSRGAKFFALLSAFLVFVSIITLCLETHPSFRLPAPVQGRDSDVKRPLVETVLLNSNSSDSENTLLSANYSSKSQMRKDPSSDKQHHTRKRGISLENNPANVVRPTEEEQIVVALPQNRKVRKKHRFGSCNSRNASTSGQPTVPHPVMDHIDLVCHIWFAAELLVRFCFCPHKRIFCMNVLNMVDLLSILPFYVELVVNLMQIRQRYATSVMHGLLVLRVLRIIRVVRLLRHSRGLQVLAFTIRASIREIVLMLCFLTLAMVVFSTLVYHADTVTFISIPHAFWWAIVTMTTVGYGDLVPSTSIGYMVGAVCAVCGVLVIAFTVPVIVGNFMLFYQYVEYGRSQQNNRTGQAIEMTDSCIPSRSTSGLPTPV